MNEEVTQILNAIKRGEPQARPWARTVSKEVA